MHRLATDDDLQAIFTIYMHESVVPFLGYDPMPLDKFRSVYAELTREKDFFVYEVNGTIAGFYKISRRPGRAHHVAYLGALAVSPDFQRQGIGLQLMTDIIQNLQNESVKRMELIVESDNPGGIAFYKSLGFEIEGTLKHFYKRADQNHYVDDYIMGLVFD